MADRLGVIRIEVDGHWDFADLLDLSESFSEAYGLFYPLVCKDQEVRSRLQGQIKDVFWRAERRSSHVGRDLYSGIPDDERLKLRSFVYHSPGAIEIAGHLMVLLLLARVANAWVNVGSNLVDLWDKIERIARRRRGRGRAIELDEGLQLSTDEARQLVFELGTSSGFDEMSCERIIDVAGTPVAALRFLVAIVNQGRRLAELQQSGLLKLPEPGDTTLDVLTAGEEVRRGVRVVKKKRRKKPKSS